MAALYTVLALYGLWYVASWRHKNRLGPWGYDWAAWCVQRFFFDVVASIWGVKNGCIFPFGQPGKPKAAGAIPCVISCAPHGSFAIGFFILHFRRLATDLRFMQFNCYAGAASVLFKIPILRELLLLLRCREASQKTLDALLETGKSVALNPGGLWEQVHTSHEREVIHLMPKLGFIRLAMRHGVPILPAYGFGENQLYRTSWYAELTLPLRRWISDRLRVGIPAVHGRFCSIFPFAGNHVFVVGQPVATGAPNPSPTAEQVNEVLLRWKAEMHRMFDENKHLLPPEVAAQGLTILVRPPAARATK